VEASATTVSLEEPTLDTPAKKKRGRPKKYKKEQVSDIARNLSKEDLIEAMRVLGMELRKPDVETEQQRSLQKVRDIENRKQEQQVLLESAAKTAAVEAHCESLGHTMDNGRSNKTAISGQIHGNGKNRMFYPICVVCQKQFPPREPGPDES
tara:strand:- start:1019 stop:1474 length:456 start_codon:yes stop_codon:yes gene_type:complete